MLDKMTVVEGSYAEAFVLQNEMLKENFDVLVMKATKDNLDMQFGNFEKIISVDKIDNEEYDVFIVHTKYEKQYLDYTITVNKSEEIAGFFVKVGIAPIGEEVEDGFPIYLNTDNAEEAAIVIGDQYPLKGTLTLPKDKSDYPVVIIVQGSGAHDQDGIIGPNRFYKDIAMGLANIGIASIRYDKRPYSYSAEAIAIKPTEDATYIQFEYTEDIDYAINYADKLENCGNIYLLGHSLGGAIVPTIALVNKKVNGAILLSGTIRRFAQISIDQNLQYAETTELTDQQKLGLDAAIEFFNQVLTHKLPAETMIQEGLYVAYYYNLDRYPTAKALEELQKPVLILQGEKDFQATMVEDYTPMQNLFGEKENFTFISFPGVDHFYKYVDGEMQTMEDIFRKGYPLKELFDEIEQWFIKTSTISK